ncbi:MAG: hypothetical protein WDA71_11310, partial [Actinomycetota bacterium]
MRANRLTCAFGSLLVGLSILAGPAPSWSQESQAPPALSSDPSRADVASTYGSGHFGSWVVDRFALPAYRYTVDEETAPQAKNTELAGRVDAWHQIGNDHVVATPYNHGYTQVWSQDRTYHWLNFYEPSARHYSGGFGYLNLGGHVVSTLYDDRARGAVTERDFGVGYGRKRTTVAPVDIEEFVYSPFGDDPVVLHDVSITNTSAAALSTSWFEYWDVNPSGSQIQVGQRKHGYLQPTYDAATRTLSVAELPFDHDTDPLTIYASALHGEVSGFETDTDAFFGAGTRAAPVAVTADRATGSIAPASLNQGDGRAMFAFRSPVRIEPGKTVTLRYAYGAAHPPEIATVVSRYRNGDPLRASQKAWQDWLPRASFESPENAWLARELQWDAYMMRSGTTYEESCGSHIISQGGYYQYGLGLQGGFRDQLSLSMAFIHTAPEITRDVIRYSAKEQEAVTGHVPYAMWHMCTPVPLPSADLDFWFLLTAGEYALGTRDFDFFDEVVPYLDGLSGTLWEHVKLAHTHMETVVGRGPHGGYNIMASTGDWTDFSAQFMQMNESMFITAQLAYAYPRMAMVAEAKGDKAFAETLRQDAGELLETLRREWTGKGWFSRGYSVTTQLGTGVLYAEPQPWALLAGAADPAQAKTLLANIQRFLTGRGAPKEVGGPSKIGSAQSPASSDPEVTERALPVFQESGALGSYGGGNAVFLGGVWFAINGPLIWAAGNLDGKVPGATDFAWDEFLRNTLANHATVFPDHWNGTISVDDVCYAWYASDPARCGDEALSNQYSYYGQIMNNHAWMLWAITKLAGIEPDLEGYRIDPHLPLAGYSLRFPGTGLAVEKGRMRGYVRPESGGGLTMRVRIPSEAVSGLRAWVGGRSVEYTAKDGFAVFHLPTSAHTAADWALTWNTTVAGGKRSLPATGGAGLAAGLGLAALALSFRLQCRKTVRPART